MDFEKARFNMVEQQVRPWDVLDQSVLDLLFVVRREDFVPAPYRALAFTDMEIPLKVDGVDSGESMWAPKLEARKVQELAIKPHDTELEIGTGSGYLSALLAHKAQHVLSTEIDPRLKAFAEGNLARAGVRNVKVELGDGSRGWPGKAPYDVIVVTGSLPVMPEGLRSQLRVGGRMAAIIGEDPAMTAELFTRATEASFDVVKLFETSVKPLKNAERPSSFRF
ncbi:MAG: protein-L-isoaspartate O-methyltransferase family protein [Burkholderiaceae bacterium]